MTPYRQSAVVVDPAGEARELAEFAKKVHSGASHITPAGLVAGAVTGALKAVFWMAVAIYTRSPVPALVALFFLWLCVSNIRVWRRRRRG